MTQLKLIITDFDGVILESEPAKHQAYIECFLAFPEHFEEFMDYHNANLTIGRYQKFEYFYKKILKTNYTKENKEWISKRFNDIIFKRVSASPFIPGALGFLKTYSKQVPIWIVSGTPCQELLRVLDALKIKKYFKKVFGTPPGKSVILADILGITGLEPKETVFIGDMNNDLKAAQENGIPFIARRNMEKFSGPRVYELDDLISIGEILSTSA